MFPMKRNILDESLSKGFFPLLMVLLLLLVAPGTNVGASLTAHDPINTRPTRVEVSHTSPHSLPLQSFTPLHDTPLLQDSRRGRGNLQEDDKERHQGHTTGHLHLRPPPPQPPPPSTSPLTSPPAPPPPPSPPPPSTQDGPHQSLNHYQSSTSMRLFQMSSLRQPDPQIMPYVMKDYLLSRKQYRESSQLPPPFQESPKSTSSSSPSPKKFPLPHTPPYLIPSLPPSSPPPLVSLWPDPPPPPPPPPAIPPPSPPPTPPSPPPPPPALSPDPRSSTMVFLDHTNPPEGRQRRLGLDSDIPGVRWKHSRIPAMPREEEDPPKPLGFSAGSSGIGGHLRSNIHFGRDKTRSFLRRYKLFNQKRMSPNGYRMKEQNHPESHDFPPSIPAESLIVKKGPKNTSEVSSDKINITATFETFPNYPLEEEDWKDQLSENLPSRQSTDEEDVFEGNLESEFKGLQLREDPTAVMQEDGEEEEEETEEKEGEFSSNVNNQVKEALASDQFMPSYKLTSNKEENTFTDATNLPNHDNDYNENNENISDTAIDMHHKVNLEKLEMELSKKDEKSASDLLLAISILQHHMIPSLRKEKEESTSNSDNSSKHVENNHEKIGDPAVTSESNEHSFNDRHTLRKGHNNYNIEIFDAMSASSEDDVADIKAITRHTSNNTIIFQPVHEVPLLPDHQSCYRWFVLVLDGNCSVIKQRMTAFVTFLKAALSSKLSVDYNDVYVPSVFCDNTFMVNISLDTIKNPQAEIKLRLLAEANTTLLEISEEIFYLEKILTKRSEEEQQDMQPLIKRPDDVELVIYIAVGCMCVFILLSVVIVALIRVCRQEGDQFDIGKTIPHQHIARSFDFPIRRPNVIYSHRFSQALTPDKCSSAATPGMENTNPNNGRGGVGVMAVTGGSGRGSVLRYDTEFAGELMGGDEEFYSMANPSMDDLYNDRRALVPSRRRATKVPGEEVIMEEDIVEEEEEEEEEEDDLEEDDEDEDEEEEEGEEERAEGKSRRANIPQGEIILEEEEGEDDDDDDDDDVEDCHFRRSEMMEPDSSSSRHMTKEGAIDSTVPDVGTSTGCEGRMGTNTGSGRSEGPPSTGNGNAKMETTGGGNTPNVHKGNQSNSSLITNTGNGQNTGMNSDTSSSNADHKDTESHLNDQRLNKMSKRPKAGVSTGSRGSPDVSTGSRGSPDVSTGSRAKGLLGSRIRGRKNLVPGNDVVFTGIDNPCYNR